MEITGKEILSNGIIQFVSFKMGKEDFGVNISVVKEIIKMIKFFKVPIYLIS